jgi:hypothetical protein
MKAPLRFLIGCLLATIGGVLALADDAVPTQPTDGMVISSTPLESMLELRDLGAIVDSIPAISQKTLLRRQIAQATFCLPQTMLGTLLYGLLQAFGSVVNTAEMNEMTIVITRMPIGASLGKFIFLGEAFQSEFAIRHEYGHTMQGYKHGPFFLLLEGVVSFVQAGISLISPSFAEGYFSRWPEDEASELGGLNWRLDLLSVD